MKLGRPDLKKTNRRIFWTVLLICSGLVILIVVTASVSMDNYMRHLTKKGYAELDRRCPQLIDSTTRLESVQFYQESWTVSRSLRMLDIDRLAKDSINLYKLDTLTRDRKNKILNRMQNQPPGKRSPANDIPVPFPMLSKYLHERTMRKLTVHTMYYDKHGDYIMEVTLTPEDFEVIRQQ